MMTTLNISKTASLRQRAFARYGDSFSYRGIATTDEARQLAVLAYQRAIDALATCHREVAVEGVTTRLYIEIFGSVVRGTSKKLGICPPYFDIMVREQSAQSEHAYAAVADFFGQRYKKPQSLNSFPSDLDVRVCTPLPDDQAANYRITDVLFEFAEPLVSSVIERAYTDFGVYVEAVGWCFHDLSACKTQPEVTADLFTGDRLVRLYGFSLDECEKLLA